MEDFTSEEKPKKKKEEASFVEKASKNTMVRQVGRTVMKEVARGLLGALGLGGKKKRRLVLVKKKKRLRNLSVYKK